MTAQLALDLPPARPVPRRATTTWCCTYCRRGYVPATDYRPDDAGCPACGADLEET